MSTRKLILSAILCGLAIVLAGGFKLIQVANEDVTVELLSLGTSQTLSEMTVAVEKMEQTTLATVVTVTMTGVDGSNATEGWRLLADGKVLGPSPTTTRSNWSAMGVISNQMNTTLYPHTTVAVTT